MATYNYITNHDVSAPILMQGVAETVTWYDAKTMTYRTRYTDGSGNTVTEEQVSRNGNVHPFVPTYGNYQMSYTFQQTYTSTLKPLHAWNEVPKDLNVLEWAGNMINNGGWEKGACRGCHPSSPYRFSPRDHPYTIDEHDAALFD